MRERTDPLGESGLREAGLIAFTATADAARAKAFYGDVLGLPLVADERSALVFASEGWMLRVQKVERVTPLPYTAVGWRVTDIHAAVRALARRGVRFERIAALTQDDAAVWRAPGGDQVAWFKDPDGAILSLTEFASG